MKLVVFAVAVSAVCGSVIPLGGLHGGLVAGGYSGLPLAGPYSGLVAGGAISGLPITGYSGLQVAGAYSGLPVSTVSHTGYSVAAGPAVHGAAPTYVAGPAPAIVAPQP